MNSRVISGVQQITGNIDVHTYSELVPWPFDYTCHDNAPGMTAAGAKRFADPARRPAATNGSQRLVAGRAQNPVDPVIGARDAGSDLVHVPVEQAPA